MKRDVRKELEAYLTMPKAHINCAECISMALSNALGIGNGLEVPVIWLPLAAVWAVAVSAVP